MNRPTGETVRLYEWMDSGPYGGWSEIKDEAIVGNARVIEVPRSMFDRYRAAEIELSEAERALDDVAASGMSGEDR